MKSRYCDDQSVTPVSRYVTSESSPPDRPTGLVVGLGRFLDVCQRPEVAQIALTDAPAVLGWRTWRQIEARHGLGVITQNLQAAARDGQLVRSAVIEAALLITHAADPKAARADAEQTLLALLSGMLHPPP